MEKVIQALKSRTVWTAVAAFVINGVPAIREFIPPQILPVVDGLLVVLVAYFRVNPRV